MGIRFRCHHCEHELNLKEFQAGRRARCPACSGRFRVPTASADFSQPLDDQEAAQMAQAVTTAQASAAAFNLRPSSSDPDLQLGQTAVAESLPLQTNAAMPQAIKEAPQAVWYVRPPSGGQYGPAEGQLFWNWLQDNRVSPDSLVWRDGWPEWQLAGDVLSEFFGVGWRLALAGQSTAEEQQPADETIDEPISDSGPVASAPVVSVAASRKKKKQLTYGIVIGILAVLALVLLGVLVSVVL